MKIYSKALNKGERFFCSIKTVKQLFQNTNISINFAGLGRSFSAFSESNIWYYVKKNVRGKIISELSMTGGYDNAILSFYVVKSTEASTELINYFENNILNQIFEIYTTALTDKTNKHKLFLVELINNELKIHNVWL